MSDQNNQEPTMEEILASIRRIISEDDPPQAAAEAAAPQGDELAHLAAAPPPGPAPHDDDVLELTDRIDLPAPSPFETVGDLDVFSPAPMAAPEPPPEPAAPPPAPRPAPVAMHEAADDDGLVSPPAATSAASAFSVLAQSIAMPRDGRTLEDVTRELLRPLLKAWLDEHLPRIVEATVQAEVERIARRS